MEYKVYGFDDCDWIAAKTEEDAKVFYTQFLDRDEVDECFEGEVSLDEKIVINPFELTKSEKARVIAVFGSMPSEDESFKVTFKDWLDVMSPINKPFIIASTEQ